MEILSFEFKNAVKNKTVCIVLGHRSSDWMDEYWAPGHSTGFRVKCCKRCHKELERERKNFSDISITKVEKFSEMYYDSENCKKDIDLKNGIKDE